MKLLQRVERHGAFLSLAAKDLDQLEDGGAAAARHATDLAGAGDGMDGCKGCF